MKRSLKLLDDPHSRTNFYLIVSICCLLGILLPVPLAPLTFCISAGVLVLAREYYSRVIYEGQGEAFRVKLVFTMAICLGNMLATIMLITFLAFAFYVMLSDPKFWEHQRLRSRPKGSVTETTSESTQGLNIKKTIPSVFAVSLD